MKTIITFFVTLCAPFAMGNEAKEKHISLEQNFEFITQALQRVEELKTHERFLPQQESYSLDVYDFDYDFAEQCLKNTAYFDMESGASKELKRGQRYIAINLICHSVGLGKDNHFTYLIDAQSGRLLGYQQYDPEIGLPTLPRQETVAP